MKDKTYKRLRAAIEELLAVGEEIQGAGDKLEPEAEEFWDQVAYINDYYGRAF